MGHRILLADDSITIQKVIELTFSDEDFELHTVGNGQKAMDEIRTIMPDIVLCDIIMPEKNGYEVCEFIKSADDLKHIPVLLLTGAFEPFDQERAKAAGCEGFLAKPFEPQTLISKVKELLANAAPAAAGAPSAPSPEPMAPSFGEAAAGRPEETVMVPPSTPQPPPPSGGPQVTPPPPPPRAPADSGPSLNEGFAVEAGERELAMGPSDRTVLLPGSESNQGAPSQGKSDDIWGDVSGATTAPSAPAPQPPSVPAAEEDDSATVFMSPPPMASEPEPVEEDDMTMMNLGGADPDATWQMPGAEDSSSEPPQPPEPEFGGFSDFASADTIGPEPTPPAGMTPPPEPPAPPPTSEPSAPVPTIEPEPMVEPMQSADTGSTIDRTIDAQPFEPPEPSPLASATPMEEDSTVSPFEPIQPLTEEPATTASPEQSPVSPQPSGSTVSAGSVDDDLVEQVAQRVVDKLSQKVIQEIAWEVVPDLAEGLIQREIEALKAKIPK